MMIIKLLKSLTVRKKKKEINLGRDVMNLIYEYADEIKLKQMEHHSELVALFKYYESIYFDLLCRNNKIARHILWLHYAVCGNCNERCDYTSYDLFKGDIDTDMSLTVSNNDCSVCYKARKKTLVYSIRHSPRRIYH